MAYTAALLVHSWLRWIVLGLGVAVLARLLGRGAVTVQPADAAAADAGRFDAGLVDADAEPVDVPPVEAAPDVGNPRPGLRLHRAFIAAIDLQFVLGLLLYLLLSPTVRAARSSMGAAMSDDTLRFYFVEHAFGMIVAVGTAHFAWSRVRKGAPATRAVTVAQAAWLLVTLASIPWPFMPYGRPLLRLVLP